MNKTVLVGLFSLLLSTSALGAGFSTDTNGVANFSSDVTMDGLVDIGTVETFDDTDATPNVSTGIYWNTFNDNLTITDFDGSPVDGQLLYVNSKAGITFDCTSSGLDCGTIDIVSATGDATTWLFTGTNWQLISFTDVTVNNGPLVAFQAYLNTAATNITGATSVMYTIVMDGETFDDGDNFNLATGAFTAPVTGRYLLTAGANVTGITGAADDITLQIVTSNTTYSQFDGRDNNLGQQETTEMTVIADMDAADTAHVAVRVQGEATDVVDITGAVGETWFHGALLR